MPASPGRFVIILLFAALSSACASDSSEQKELAELRMEIEQLTNALGRLEFRVFELENQQSPATDDEPEAAAADNSTGTEPAADPSAMQDQGNKRFDLVPVE
jgi:uncharacterized protein (DUF2141 family)